jgi:hypothetical protein
MQGEVFPTIRTPRNTLFPGHTVGILTLYYLVSFLVYKLITCENPFLMRTKKKNIVDQCGSAMKIRFLMREIAWGIVEQVKINDDKCTEVAEEFPYYEDGDSLSLPLEFSSKNGKPSGVKRPRPQRADICTTPLSVNLPVPVYNGTFMESNVCKLVNHDVYSGYYVRILGNGPRSAMGSSKGESVAGTNTEHTTLVQVLSDLEAHPEEAIAPIEVERSTQLLDLWGAEKTEAHRLVQQDEVRLLRVGAPPEEEVHAKYWDQRYRLLSKFDRGVQLDAESFYSITPEAAARHVTSVCLSRAQQAGAPIRRVLDCFSGCGGNTIPFVLRKTAQGEYVDVVAVDFDSVKLNYLR